MFGRISKFFNRPKSKTIAKNRLQLILIQDKMGTNAPALEALRTDLISLLSRYFEINDSEVEIDLLREKEQMAFVANVPITNLK
jgi:cell division topological specificity factor